MLNVPHRVHTHITWHIGDKIELWDTVSIRYRGTHITYHIGDHIRNHIRYKVLGIVGPISHIISVIRSETASDTISDIISDIMSNIIFTNLACCHGEEGWHNSIMLLLNVPRPA